MAEYRLSYKRGKVGYAGSHAAYILREGKYKYKEDLIYKEYGNLPKFSGNNALNFWKAADELEGINRNAYREFELNIPNELSHNDSIKVIKNFIEKEIKTDFPYTYAIHESYNEQGEKNIHCHLMFSERKSDGIERERELFFKRANTKNPHLGGARKDRLWQKKERLLDLRKSWEIIQNNALEKNGFSQRVDCRSLAERRKELLEKGEFEKAESLNRKPVNINGKILIKMNKIGYTKLSLNEKKIVDQYNQAKKEKKEKERRIAVIKGTVIPTKNEIINRLNEIEKIDEGSIKRQALNIITKGELNKNYYDLKNVNKLLIAYPTNEKLLSKKEKIEDKLHTIADTHILTPKYNRIVEQLKRDYTREKNLHIDNLKTYYKKDYINEKIKFDKKEDKKINDNLYDKYKKLSTSELIYKLHGLENTTSQFKAAQILTKYRLEGITQNNLLYKKLIDKKENELRQNKLFNNTSIINKLDKDLKDLKDKLNKNENEYKLIIDNLHNNPTTIKNLSEKIEANSIKEKEILKQLIEERNKNPKTNESIIKDHIEMMADLNKSKRLYNYFINKNQDEKHNKSISTLSNRIDSITTAINSREQEFNNINSFEKNKILNKLKTNEEINIKNIESNLNKINTGINKMKEHLSPDPVRYNLNTIQLITINKLSNGEYFKVFKNVVNAEKEYKELENKYNNSNIFKKAFISKELNNKKYNLQQLKLKEESIINNFKNTQLFKDKSQNTRESFILSLNNLNKKFTTLNRDKDKKQTTIMIINKLTNKQFTKEKEIRPTVSKLYSLKNINKLNYDLSTLLNTEEKTGHNNLEIKLENNKNKGIGF